jgi:hypothetical protein
MPPVRAFLRCHPAPKDQYRTDVQAVPPAVVFGGVVVEAPYGNVDDAHALPLCDLFQRGAHVVRQDVQPIAVRRHVQQHPRRRDVGRDGEDGGGQVG